MNIDLLVKQSKFNKDLTLIIDTITPIICDKKITKREIDKANTALLDKFGYYIYADGESKTSLYNVYLQKDYFTLLKIHCADRWVRHTPDSSGYSFTSYIPEDVKTIYCDRETGGITTEELNKYKPSKEYTPTKSEILASYKKYEQLNTKIKELENKRSKLPFHYYFK